MGTEVDRLEIAVQAEASKAVGQLDKLISKLNQVSSTLTATNTSGLRNFASGIKQLSSAMQNMSGIKTTDFNRLASGIEKLSTINESALYKSANGIRNFTNSLKGIGSVSDDAVKIGDIVRNVSRLGNASMQRLTTTLPQLSIALKDFMTTLSTSPNVSDNIIKMTNAIASLASNGAKFSSTVNGLGRAAKTLSRSNNEVAESNNKVNKSFGSVKPSVTSLTSAVGKLAAAYFALKQVVGFVGESIEKSMDFTETINLFQTSYKKIGEEAAVKNGMAWGSKSADAYAKAFIDRAQTFNDRLVNALGLDPNTMMNYQAIFAQISSAMGLTANTAENISESFTMLGNDIASLWNLNTKDAMEKLQAGLTGQVRPLRELGVDITQANLQLTAYRHGVKESVKDMSQAEKVQLRWLTIMDQSSVAFGDMAKTINSPANQLRILKQQWDNLSRSIGNVFMPVVTTILPYINAVVISLRNMIDTLATALGYELPDYTDSNIYTDVTGDIGGVTDATDKATKANEKYKKSIMGIDELNILSKPASSSSNSGSINTGSGNSKLDDVINEKTASYMKKFNEELEKMSNRSKDIANGIENFFALFAKNAEPSIKALKKLWDEGLSKFVGFVARGVVDFYDSFLVPVGKWILGKGLPELFDVLNNLLKSINWDKLNSSFNLLWDALSRFVIGVGSGLINFIKGITAALTPAVSSAINILTDALKGIAEIVNKMPNDALIALGGAIGGLATSILLYNGVSAVPGIIKNLSGTLSTFIGSIKANPLLLIASAIGALAGAFLTLGKSQYDETNTAKYVKSLDKLINKVKDYNDATKTMLRRMSDKKNVIETEYGAVDILADKYFKLADKQKLSNKEQSLLKAYTKELIDKIPELSNLIDEQTGAYKGTKQQIQGCIDKTKEYYLVQAAQDDLIEIAKHQYDTQKNLNDLEEKRVDTKKRLTQKQKEFNEAFMEIVNSDNGSKYPVTDEMLAKEETLYEDVKNLKEALNKVNGEVAATKSSQDKLNSSWDYAVEYIQNYSDGAKTNLGDVKKAIKATGDTFKNTDISGKAKKLVSDVKDTFNNDGTAVLSVKGWLDRISSVVQNFKIPDLSVKLQLDATGFKTTDPLNIYGTRKVTTHAVGGFPNTGDMFIANEAGPELVGSFGGRSNAVANNNQIVAGIEEAAYRGYARAIIDFGGNNQSSSDRIIVESNLYVDSEKMYGINQKGKAKYERRNQTALNPT